MLIPTQTNNDAPPSGVPGTAAVRPGHAPSFPLTGFINHVGVQTADLATAITWYQDFFGCVTSWRMTGGFSALSHRRLPGLSELVEVAVADVRFHLFTRNSGPQRLPAADADQFQHVCLTVPSPEDLRSWRAHWFALYESGRYRFARPEPASEIDTDADGMQSFYAYDVNGLEFEFAYLPGAADVGA
ncbi:VOC family protein [Micromonospora marina]|uniref:VOC family protein n=1 Tax=Micromonospora marina TaxID=307120 RepID=UPI003D759688